MQEAGGRAPALGLLTASFAGDYELCELLVDSVRAFAPDTFHRIVVPASDLGLFARLAGPSTEVVANSTFLPPGSRPVPRAPRALRARFPKVRRDAFLRRGRVVRGWLMQQVVKLSAAASMPTEMVMHCDSDVFLVRRPVAADYWLDGRPRLFSVPRGGKDEAHYLWHESAAHLLGLPATRYFGTDWIGPFVTWHRETTHDLLDAVAGTAGAPWYDAVLGSHDFSEYTLYGAYVQFSGECRVAHTPSSAALSANTWNEPLATDQEVRDFCATLLPQHLGGLIQSTHDLPTGRRRHVVEVLQRRAEAIE